MPETLTCVQRHVQATHPITLTFGRVLTQLDIGLTLFVGEGTAQLALPFCAPFLVREETLVAVDAANCFNLYRLTEWARRKRLASPALLNRLRIARAFTPFQLATILHHIGGEMERYRASCLVITGLPECLYDEELTEPEARNTFIRCRESLVPLARRFPVLAFSEWPPHPVGKRTRFLDSLVSLARSVFEVHRTEPIVFAPVKAPGLLTLPKGGTEHGKNGPDRESSPGARP